MKILLTSIGTRGDMEPFLAIGELCKEKGHQVICAFPEQFKSLVEDSNMEFASLGPEFLDMINSDLGKAVLGGGGSRLKKLWGFVKLARRQGKINKELVRRQYEIVQKERPERIVHNGKAMYPVIWDVKNTGKTTFISPVPYLHYVKHHTHVAFNSNYGEFFNKLTFKIAEWGLVKTIMASMKWLNITGISKMQIKEVLSNHNVIYTISPALFPRPSYWPKNMQVLGYHERNKLTNWQPTHALKQFLARHSKIIFITFGSMTNPEPDKKTKIFLEILERNNIPAIINTASGGLVELDSYNHNLIHFVENIPYDWIFTKVYAVIHHGGSGTTHMALKNGCSTMIIPHIIDQFVWNRIIAEKGIGPKGIKIGKINPANLEPKILELVYNHSFKSKAEQTQIQMQKENFGGELCRIILAENTSI